MVSKASVFFWFNARWFDVKSCMNCLRNVKMLKLTLSVWVLIWIPVCWTLELACQWWGLCSYHCMWIDDPLSNIYVAWKCIKKVTACLAMIFQMMILKWYKSVQMLACYGSMSVYIQVKCVYMFMLCGAWFGMVQSLAVSWVRQIGLPWEILLLSLYCPYSRHSPWPGRLAARGNCWF